MLILLFESIHYVLKTEKLFKASKIDYQIIPTPRELSSECGSAMKINENDKSKVEKILKEKKINVKIKLV